jgi:hypothetical protein
MSATDAKPTHDVRVDALQRGGNRRVRLGQREEGLPAKPPKDIVTLGIAVWVGAWPMFLAPIAVFATANWVHIPFEEAKMRRQFGAMYDDYVGRVRRWM